MEDTYLIIDQQYADDISWVTTSESKIQEIEKKIPIKPEARNLIVNHTKTEKYCITRKGPEEWKKCKYLGTIFETEKDIHRRKSLAISAYNKLKHILESKRTKISLRMRTFNSLSLIHI